MVRRRTEWSYAIAFEAHSVASAFFSLQAVFSGFHPQQMFWTILAAGVAFELRFIVVGLGRDMV